jgi:hypothetical protein
MAWTNLKSEDVGIKVKGTPAVSSWKEGRLDVFIRSLDNRLFHRVYENETWQGANWRDLSDGHTFETSPAAVSWSPDRIDLFAVWNRQVQHRAYQGGAWGPWAENLGGITTEAPTAASWKPERVDVLIRTADNFLSQRFWEPGVGWRDWENVGGQRMTLTSAPVAAATGPNRVDCFGRGSNDGHLIHAWYQGGLKQDWMEPDNLTIRDAPAIVSGATADRGRVDVFIRGTDDIMRHRVYYTALQPGQPSAGGWEPGSNWNHTSTNKIFSAPAAVAWWSGNALKRIDCFAQDANNNLMHTRWM